MKMFSKKLVWILAVTMVMIIVGFCQSETTSAQTSYIDFSLYAGYVDSIPKHEYAVNALIETKTIVKLNNNSPNELYFTVKRKKSLNGTVYFTSTSTFPISAYAYVDADCSLSQSSTVANTYTFEVEVTVKNAAGGVVGTGIDVHEFITLVPEGEEGGGA